MHEVLAEIEKMKTAKETLENWLSLEISGGPEDCCLDAVGKLTDSIKDLTESAEKCMKAKYYERMLYLLTVMNGDESNQDVYGYDHWHYGNGRFAPTGHGHRVAGYTPNIQKADWHMPDMDDDDLIRYYPGATPMHRSQTGSAMSFGYPRDTRTTRGGSRSSRYGYSYDEFQDAKRHFKETGAKEDRDEMHQKIKHAMGDIGMMLSDMIENADPDVQKELKMHIATVLDETGMKR